MIVQRPSTCLPPGGGACSHNYRDSGKNSWPTGDSIPSMSFLCLSSAFSLVLSFFFFCSAAPAQWRRPWVDPIHREMWLRSKRVMINPPSCVKMGVIPDTLPDETLAVRLIRATASVVPTGNLFKCTI
jgi:hypothetical protein